MQNLVNKFTPQTDVTIEDDGVVAIEYVLVAGLVAAGVVVAFGATLWTEMLAKLNGIF